MAEADELVLSLLVLAPFVGGLALILVPGRQPNTIRGIATAVTGFTFALSIYITLRHYLSARRGGVLATDPRRMAAKLGIGFTLGVDGISALMVLLNGVVAFAGTLVAWRLPTEPRNSSSFSCSSLQASMASLWPLICSSSSSSTNLPSFRCTS